MKRRKEERKGGGIKNNKRKETPEGTEGRKKFEGRK